ncbi:hypothetical protein QJQ45_010448 [Haematococcus lacustris]|nr:hypothetical protein QJQ45_010448 [Haematococcus lacustris]
MSRHHAACFMMRTLATLMLGGTHARVVTDAAAWEPDIGRLRTLLDKSQSLGKLFEHVPVQPEELRVLAKQRGRRATHKHIVALNRLRLLLQLGEEPTPDQLQAIMNHRDTNLDLDLKHRQTHQSMGGLTACQWTDKSTYALPGWNWQASIASNQVIRITDLFNQPQKQSTAAPPPHTTNTQATGATIADLQKPSDKRPAPNPLSNNKSMGRVALPDATDIPLPHLDPTQLYTWKEDQATRGTASHSQLMLNQMFRHREKIKKVFGWQITNTTLGRDLPPKAARRTHQKQKPKEETDVTMQQQHWVTWHPSRVEKWALPLYAKNGYHPQSVKPYPRSQLRDDDCDCELCWSPNSRENDEGAADMYVCDTCQRTYHWQCLLDCKCAKPSERPGCDDNTEWECPSCAPLAPHEKEVRKAAADEEIVEVHWEPSAEALTMLKHHTDFCEHIEEYKTEIEARQHALTSTRKDGDIDDDLVRQSMSDTARGQWQSSHGDPLRLNVRFDVLPTNPQLDICPTGRCEVWLRHADFYPCQQTTALTQALPQPITQQVVAVYNTDGKCVGVITPARAANLLSRYNETQKNAPTPLNTSFATELASLLARHGQATADATHTTPTPIVHVLRQHLEITKERYTTPLHCSPLIEEYYSPCERDKLFGSLGPPLLCQHQGMSLAQPNKTHITVAVRHALHAAQAPTHIPTRTIGATYMRWITEHPHLCTKVGTFAPHALQPDPPQAWTGGIPYTCSNKHHSLLVLIHNSSATHHLQARNPLWLDNLRCALSQLAGRKFLPPTNSRPPPFLPAHTSLPGAGTYRKLPPDTQTTPTALPPTSNTPDTNWSGTHLQSKVRDWKSWTYTDGSCTTAPGAAQRIGAGIYHPQGTQQHHTINPCGEGATNTITRAELAAIKATLDQGHTHIATDTASPPCSR